MLLRFGYVANATRLADASPSRTITATNFVKVPEGERFARLRRIASENLTNTIRILRFNVAHKVHIYRFTSKLIPLATHPLIADWDYLGDLCGLLEQIGEIVRQSGMRVSAHPDHFTVLNSPREHILEDATADLLYQVALFETMGLDDRAKMIIHVGGSYRAKAKTLDNHGDAKPAPPGGRDAAMDRFRTNVAALPATIKRRLVLENDDKSYSAADALTLGRELGIPVCLDVHHFRVNHGPTETLQSLVPAVFATWTGLPPKIHVSSPKAEREVRSHADYVEPIDMQDVLVTLRHLENPPPIVDIMVEAKMKDQAMFKLVADLSGLPGLTRIDDANVRLEA